MYILKLIKRNYHKQRAGLVTSLIVWPDANFFADPTVQIKNNKQCTTTHPKAVNPIDADTDLWAEIRLLIDYISTSLLQL